MNQTKQIQDDALTIAAIGIVARGMLESLMHLKVLTHSLALGFGTEPLTEPRTTVSGLLRDQLVTRFK